MAELNVLRLFSTPIITTFLDRAEALNGALLSYILPLAENGSGRRRSNMGGWQSNDDFHLLDLPAARALCKDVTDAVNSATAVSHRNGLVEPAFDWRINAWINVNPPGASNAIHGHPGAFWSAVYYVDDGGADSEDGGELRFHDPRGLLASMHDPLLRFRVEGCLSAGLSETLRPEPGLLVLFPSWLLHSVEPCHGIRSRVSIAFNFSTPACNAP